MDLDLKNLLANRSISRKDKVLIVLAFGDQKTKPVKDIRGLAIANGLRSAKSWNFSQLLKSLGSAVIRVPDGWELTDEGLMTLETLGVTRRSPAQSLQPSLRKYASDITKTEVREFVEEAIAAIEFNLYRSAVVFSWVGAISVLHEVVLRDRLSEFNREAYGRFPKWKTARTADDLGRMKEYDFLQIIQKISVIGKNTKDELEQCLKLRNSCGHPSSLKVGEHRVTSHVETLILNVFTKFTV